MIVLYRAFYMTLVSSGTVPKSGVVHGADLRRLQVSHHPPIGVGHGENDNWTYDIVSAPSTKFLGNSVEIYPVGVIVSHDPNMTPASTLTLIPHWHGLLCSAFTCKAIVCMLFVMPSDEQPLVCFMREGTRLLTGGHDIATGRSRIKLKSTGEVFTINPCNVKANNVIVGSTWVDNEGDYALINTTTGARADMYFTPCGWWGNGRYQVGKNPVVDLFNQSFLFEVAGCRALAVPRPGGDLQRGLNRHRALRFCAKL